VQQAIADYLREHPACGADLPRSSRASATGWPRFLAAAAGRRCARRASYFSSSITGACRRGPDVDWPICGSTRPVGLIPLSVFYREPPPMTLLRLCFAKRDETLVEGARRLAAWARGQRTMNLMEKRHRAQPSARNRVAGR